MSAQLTDSSLALKEARRRVAEFSSAGEDVCECVTCCFDGKRFLRPRCPRTRQGDRLGPPGNAVDGASLPEFSAGEADVGAIVVGNLGNLRRFHFLVAW